MSKAFLFLFLLLLLAACLNSGKTEPSAALEKIDFYFKSTDLPNFCKNISESKDNFFRNGDSLWVIVRDVAGCQPFHQDYRIQKDSLELPYMAIPIICYDTLRYDYLGYIFRVTSEGTIHILARDSAGSRVSLDTTLDTRRVTKRYECR